MMVRKYLRLYTSIELLKFINFNSYIDESNFYLGVLRQTVKPGTPPDFILKVTIDRHPVRFFVHKRPHVDFFLNMVSLIAS